MRKSTIKPGDRFGYLIILHKTGTTDISPKRTIYKCQCDCGNIKIIDAGNLRKSDLRSCGCIRRKLAIEKGKKQRTEKSYANLLYGECKRTARYRKLEFTLSLDDHRHIVTKNCHYCKSLPKLKGNQRVGIEFATNGIDRINNKLGYIKENCVPCCSKCNTMKLDMELMEFLNHVKLISKNW